MNKQLYTVLQALRMIKRSVFSWRHSRSLCTDFQYINTSIKLQAKTTINQPPRSVDLNKEF